MPAYWKITDRAIVNGTPTGDRGPLQYFVSDNGYDGGQNPLANLKQWQLVSANDFKTLLAAAADQFPGLGTRRQRTTKPRHFFDPRLQQRMGGRRPAVSESLRQLVHRPEQPWDLHQF